MAVDALTDGMPDGEMQFLRSSDGLSGNDEREIYFLPQAPAASGKKGHSAHTSVSRRCRRSKKVVRLSARGVEKEKIAFTDQRLDLAGEHVLKAEVVGTGREDRRVGRERQST